MEHDSKDGVPGTEEANILHCDIVVSEFERQSHYYVPFWIYKLGKGMSSLIPSRYGLNTITSILR